MGKKDPRVDAYIAKAAPFARPILTHLREVIHATSSDIDEDMKWSFPHFMYKGILASMASFKEHAAFGFWKGSLIVNTAGRSAEAMGQFGRITSVKDLPSKRVLTGYVKQAVKLNDAGVPSPTRSKSKVVNGKRSEVSAIRAPRSRPAPRAPEADPASPHRGRSS